MGKLDIGVGEEFPLDEQARRESAGEHTADAASGCDYGPNFGGSRQEQREAWRRWRHQMRAEWHARKHAMRDQFRREFSDEHHRHHVLGSLAVAGLALVGLAALLGHLHHDN